MGLNSCQQILQADVLVKGNMSNSLQNTKVNKPILLFLINFTLSSRACHGRIRIQKGKTSEICMPVKPKHRPHRLKPQSILKCSTEPVVKFYCEQVYLTNWESAAITIGNLNRARFSCWFVSKMTPNNAVMPQILINYTDSASLEDTKP